jgi:alkanesulfonate monooxygenase SsuD/methylene tetrahydromethanopterin reductase-like flavin-dependent oxidoreductase (luciferase family)
VVERVGRLADGWFPQFAPDDKGRATLERMHGYAQAAGRDPADIGIEGRVSLQGTTPEMRLKTAEAWRDLGASHLSVNTMRAGLQTPLDHISAIEAFKETVASVVS